MKKGLSIIFLVFGWIYAILSLTWVFSDKAGFSLPTLVLLSVAFFVSSYFINKSRGVVELEKEKEMKRKKVEKRLEIYQAQQASKSTIEKGSKKEQITIKSNPQTQNKSTQAVQHDTVQSDKKAGLFSSSTYCPHCRSLNVSFMQNNKKGFSVGKAVGGAALTGGIGTLAGFAGKKGKNQWHCQNCGKTFETKK